MHGQPGWVAALTPLSVDGMIVAASATLLAESRSGNHGSLFPSSLLAVGSVASLAANVAVARPTITGRLITGWPSFALICSYELLMRHVRRSATGHGARPVPESARIAFDSSHSLSGTNPRSGWSHGRRAGDLDLQREAWQWALANRTDDGSLPSGRMIAQHYGRHERWGRLVKSAGQAARSALTAFRARARLWMNP